MTVFQSGLFYRNRRGNVTIQINEMSHNLSYCLYTFVDHHLPCFVGMKGGDSSSTLRSFGYKEIDPETIHGGL